MIKATVMPYEEYQDRVKRGKDQHGSFFHYFAPGDGYYCPWHHDPLDLDPSLIKYGENLLSPYYWSDWADKRPPIMLVCPNRRQWMIDQKASNGLDWIVTGALEALTATPSIVCGNYHGYIRDGYFTDDIEGRTYM